MCEYIIDSAEKTQKSATEQETRTMLYLMGYLEDSKEIDAFIIDAFNDVTAVNTSKGLYWDSQSKVKCHHHHIQLAKNWLHCLKITYLFLILIIIFFL